MTDRLMKILGNPFEMPAQRLVRTVRDYRFHTLRQDMVAGLSVAVVAAPQSMAYAMIAEVPPVYGLFTVIVQCFIGSLFASHPLLSIGPTNTQSLLVASVVTRLRVPGDVEAYLSLVIALTLLKGIFQLAMSAVRLGNLVRYASASVIVGFTAGAGVLIIVAQLHHFLGITIERSANHWPGVIGVAQRLAPHLGEIHWQAILLGSLSLGIVIGARLISSLAPGPLLAVAFSAVVVATLGWTNQELGLIGEISAQLPPLTMPFSHVTSIELEALVMGAFALSLLGLMEAYSISKCLGAHTGTRVNANQELFGQGLTNFLSSFFGGIPGSASFSRSALNHYAGGKTIFSGLFNALFVLLCLILLGPFARYVPMTAIAAILFVIAAGLIDTAYVRRLFKSHRADAAVCVGTFVATLCIPLAYAVFVGVALNLALYLRRAGQLHIAEMVQSNGEDQTLFVEKPFNDELPVGQASTATQPSRHEVVFLQIEGDLFFAVADELHERLNAALARQPAAVIIRLKRTHSIDATVLSVFEEFIEHMHEREAHVILCGVRPDIMDQMARFGLIQQINPDNVFPMKQGVFSSAKLAMHRAKTLVGPQVHFGRETPADWHYEI